MRNRNLLVQVVLALRFRKISLSLLCLLMFISLTPQGFTADVYWINPAGGNWDTPGNWSTGAVPGLIDDVFITLDGTYTVTLTGSKSINSLILGDTVNTGVQTLLIQANSATHSTLTAASDFTNAGTKTLTSSYSGTISTLQVTSGTLTNTGTITANVDSGGGRTISANLVNDGTVDQRHSYQHRHN